MTEKKPSEVSIQAAITKSNLSVSARSKAIAAFDRLLGGLIGIPAAWLERIEDRIHNRANRESIIQDAAANRISAAISNDEELSKVVAELALSSQLVPIVNKARVAQLTVDELLRSTGGTDSQTDQDDSEDVDEDWLNHFATYSERASSEDVRQLWARVLAGEIRRTGSFSLTSLRLLSELDKRMATTFEREVKNRMMNAEILKPKIEEMHGSRLASLTFLEEVGLLQTIDSVGGVVRTISSDSDGRGFLREQHLLLVLESQKPVEFPVISLTRAGSEIASILPPVDPQAVLEQVGRAIRDKVTSMEIRRIVDKTGTRYNTAPYKILKAKEG